MLIRTIVIITIFCVFTLLSGCQDDNQGSNQSTLNNQDSTDDPSNNKRNYLLRVKIVEALIPASRIKIAVSEHHATIGQFSGAAEMMADLPPNISVDNVTGRITVHLKDIDDSFSQNDSIQLVPEITNSSISWRCESHTVAELTPPGCQQ